MIVREIVERPAGSADPPLPPQPPKLASGGFPIAKRREPRAKPTPVASPSKIPDNLHPPPNIANDTAKNEPNQPLSEAEQMRHSIEEENLARIQAMSLDEREQEAEELTERFGSKVADLMRKRREARAAKIGKEPIAGSSTVSASEVPVGEVDKVRKEVGNENRERVKAMSADLVKESVMELEDRFGADLLASLVKRAEQRAKGSGDQAAKMSKDEDILPVRLGQARSLPPASTPDETSPEALKERYFPNHTAEPEKLAWLQPATAPSASDTSVRFDLTGRVLSTFEKEEIPTFMGLHHHGTSPHLAGYTIQDILWLSRSTVSSQRIMMLGILDGILKTYLAGELEEDARVACDQEHIRRKAMDLGLDILINTPKSVGILHAGFDLMCTAIGAWSSVVYSGPDETDKIGVTSIPFADILPRIQELLLGETGIEGPLLSIISEALLQSRDLAETMAPLVPLLIRSDKVLSRPWPMENGRKPWDAAIWLLLDIVNSSRSCAVAMIDADIIRPLLKFLVTSTWPDQLEEEDAFFMANILKIYTSLGRYGLAVSLATDAIDIFRSLGRWCREHCLDLKPDRCYHQLAIAYFDLLQVWTTCAIDPHQTTPDHALTWAQVTAFGWHDEAIDCLGLFVVKQDLHHYILMRSVLELLVAHTIGLSINGINSGIEQKREIITCLHGAGLNNWTRMMFETWRWTLPWDSAAAPVVLQILRLASTFGSLDEHGGPVIHRAFIQQFQRYMIAPRNHRWESARFEYEILRIARRKHLMDDRRWRSEAFGLLPRFNPGEEPLALDQIDELLRADWTVIHPELADSIKGVGHPDSFQILRPLLHYAILPTAEAVVGPNTCNHIYIKATTTLRKPSPSPPDAKRRPGLPLPSDWLFTPLNELLQSSTSPALAQAPPDWDASELDIVRATLLIAELSSATKHMSRSSLLLNLMKVFMLEHDQSASTAEPEAFRDTFVAQSLLRLIKPLLTPETVSIQKSDAKSTKDTGEKTMEKAAIPFLGHDIPFFQFYTDFVSLYEAISYSDPIFSQLVLPALAMSYPVDFRKLLWVEQPTALRSIRTKVQDVPLESDLTAFFSPRESDVDVLAGYTRALVRGWVSVRTEFLWRIATFHLADLFWNGAESEKIARVNLLKAIVGSAQPEVIKEIVRLDLGLLGQGAYVEDSEVQPRLSLVDELLGPQAKAKVERLL